MRSRIVACSIFLLFLAGAATAKPLSFRAETGAQASFVTSWESGRGALPSFGYGLGACLELDKDGWILARMGLEYGSVSATPFDENYFSFRAFEATRLSLMTGYGFPMGLSRFDLLGGAALAVSRFTSTSLMDADLYLLLLPRLSMPLPNDFLPGLALNIGLPLEYIFRGTAKSASAGLSATLSFPLRSRGL